jgi:hypothetical protein
VHGRFCGSLSPTFGTLDDVPDEKILMFSSSGAVMKLRKHCERY